MAVDVQSHFWLALSSAENVNMGKLQPGLCQGRYYPIFCLLSANIILWT